MQRVDYRKGRENIKEVHVLLGEEAFGMFHLRRMTWWSSLRLIEVHDLQSFELYTFLSWASAVP